MKAIAIVLSIYLGSYAVSAGKGIYADRARLCGDLSSNYERDLFPDGPDGGPLPVHHSLHLQWIDSLHDDVLALHAWEGWFWNDNRLRWAPGDYGNVTQIQIPSTSVWLPDIAHLNSVDQPGIPDGLNVMINHNGSVAIVPPKTFRSVCVFNEHSLYTDNSVTCSIRFMSWTHSNDTLVLEPLFDSIQEEAYMTKDPRWLLESTEVISHIRQYDCCPNQFFPEVEYVLHLHRVA